MRKDVTLRAEPRESRGKNEARRLRVKGLAPGVLYGAGETAVAVSVNPNEVNKILQQPDRPQHDFQLSRAGRGKHAGHDRGLAERTRSVRICCMST